MFCLANVALTCSQGEDGEDGAPDNSVRRMEWMAQPWAGWMAGAIWHDAQKRAGYFHTTSP